MDDNSRTSDTATASVPEGMKPIDIPVPIFPQRTASVPNIGVSHRQQASTNNNSRPFQTFQTKADWRLFLTVEERQLIRKKISTAYESRTQTYEELLQTCAAIEEELVFVSAPSRLDYFKTGMQFEKRVTEKRKHLTEGPASGNNGYGATNNNSSNTGGGVFSPGKPPTMEVISEGGGNRDSVSNDSFSDDESDSSGGANKRQRASSK